MRGGARGNFRNVQNEGGVRGEVVRVEEGEERRAASTGGKRADGDEGHYWGGLDVDGARNSGDASRIEPGDDSLLRRARTTEMERVNIPPVISV